jgi:putative transposase
MSRSGNVWDNAAMESFFSSLKTERTARKTYRMRDEAEADEPGIRTQIEK